MYKDRRVRYKSVQPMICYQQDQSFAPHSMEAQVTLIFYTLIKTYTTNSADGSEAIKSLFHASNYTSTDYTRPTGSKLETNNWNIIDQFFQLIGICIFIKSYFLLSQKRSSESNVNKMLFVITIKYCNQNKYSVSVVYYIQYEQSDLELVNNDLKLIL